MLRNRFGVQDWTDPAWIWIYRQLQSTERANQRSLHEQGRIAGEQYPCLVILAVTPNSTPKRLYGGLLTILTLCLDDGNALLVTLPNFTCPGLQTSSRSPHSQS